MLKWLSTERVFGKDAEETKIANFVKGDDAYRIYEDVLSLKNVMWFCKICVNVIPCVPLRKVRPSRQQLLQNLPVISNNEDPLIPILT
jgi:hypothetical protein